MLFVGSLRDRKTRRAPYRNSSPMKGRPVSGPEVVHSSTHPADAADQATRRLLWGWGQLPKRWAIGGYRRPRVEGVDQPEHDEIGQQRRHPALRAQEIGQLVAAQRAHPAVIVRLARGRQQALKACHLPMVLRDAAVPGKLVRQCLTSSGDS